MFCVEPPHPPESLDETGLDKTLVGELVLKHLLCLGEFRLADVAQRIKLPVSMVEPTLEEHRKEKLVEVKGAANYSAPSYLYRLTEAGRKKAQQLMELCRYAGPAPVSLRDYRQMVQLQTVENLLVGDDDLKSALSHLVVSDDVRRRLGRAMISGQPVFVYGPSGNGKTSIAEAIGRVLRENIYIPHAVAVGGQVVSVFDPVIHLAAEPSGAAERGDPRWLSIKRPVVIAGGELSLKMLELNFDSVSNCYDAPLQMKANNGLFLIDDFGRQQVEPSSLLNRWIVPLERKIDFLTLHTGTKFPVPFDMLVMFFTNLEPKNLVDEAFMRRLRYKIRIDRPSEEEFLAIFREVCRCSGLEFNQQAYTHLLEQWYGGRKLALSACHPRDLIDLILTDARYNASPPQLTRESIQNACTDYFGELNSERGGSAQ